MSSDQHYGSLLSSQKCMTMCHAKLCKNGKNNKKAYYWREKYIVSFASLPVNTRWIILKSLSPGSCRPRCIRVDEESSLQFTCFLVDERIRDIESLTCRILIALRGHEQMQKFSWALDLRLAGLLLPFISLHFTRTCQSSSLSVFRTIYLIVYSDDCHSRSEFPWVRLSSPARTLFRAW